MNCCFLHKPYAETMYHICCQAYVMPNGGGINSHQKKVINRLNCIHPRCRLLFVHIHVIHLLVVVVYCSS